MSSPKGGCCVERATSERGEAPGETRLLRSEEHLASGMPSFRITNEAQITLLTHLK